MFYSRILFHSSLFCISFIPVPYAEMSSRQRKYHLFKLVHIVFAILFNDRHCFLFKVTFAGNIYTLKSTNFTMATVGAGSACP